MLEVTHGRAENQIVANELRRLLRSMELEGSLYIGYPILATADHSVTVDSLLVTVERGLVAFLFDEHPPDADSEGELWRMREDRQDQLFIAVENSLRRHEALRRGRRLGVKVQIIMVVSPGTEIPEDLVGVYSPIQDIPRFLEECEPFEEQYFKPLQAALQKVATMRPPKRRAGVRSSQSKGAVIKRIEREIANLDRWQKGAAIESPDGAQRIRGLAGSGKTIVLALKAAYLHAQNPDWKICVTFSSRALYQQFEDLVRRFSFEHLNDEPNWQNLRILHSWGGRSREGLYQQIAIHCGSIPRDFMYGRAKYGMDRAFEGICSELWAEIATSSPEPLFDAVLIDEAQDLPIPFFKIIYKVTRQPKRIIWAYDELQNLSESAIPTVDEQFGTNAQGQPLVTLTNTEDGPDQDIVLPICYRNTPWALTLAHGLGLGTARENGLVQSFDDPSLWTHIGYNVVDGELQKGSSVTLERGSNSYPSYFPELLTPDDAIQTNVFSTAEDQARWVAQSIWESIHEDELEYDDFLIILPNAYTARTQAAIVLDALNNVGLNGHLAGDTTSQDVVFEPDSIAIANIYRSKGNESPIVYVLNAQHCLTNRRPATARNILFTAITRCKCWVRICGVGERMRVLQREIDSIRSNNYRLRFSVPTDEELQNIRQIHRDTTARERARVDEAERGLRIFVDALDRGEISLNDMPMHLRTSIARHLEGNADDPH